jgi:hypothetical protein
MHFGSWIARLQREWDKIAKHIHDWSHVHPPDVPFE